jgi:hypothetical protein
VNLKPRKFYVWFISLGAVLVIYLLYNRLGGTPEVDFHTPAEFADAVADSNGEIGMIGDVGVGRMEVAEFITRNQETREIEEIFGFEEVLDEEADEWEINKPYLNMFRRNFKCYITADRGRVRIETVADRHTPKDIRLIGNVVVRILPENSGNIRESFIYLDDLVFISERSQFSSAGPVRFVSEDTKMLGRALEGIYNNQLNRLEYLRIFHLESLRLKSSMAALFGTAKTEPNKPAEVGRRAQTRQPDKPVVIDDSQKVKAPPPEGTQKVQQGKGEYYRCTFGKNVVIDTPERFIVADDQISISNIFWAKSPSDKSGRVDTGGKGKAKESTPVTREAVTSAKNTKAHGIPVADQNRPQQPSESEQPDDIVITCDNGILLAPMDSNRSIKDFPDLASQSKSVDAKVPEDFQDSKGRTTLTAKEIDYCAATDETVARGPLELTFDVNDPMLAGPNEAPVPVKVTAKKQGRFLPASNQAIFEGDSVCTMLREDPNGRRKYTLSGPKLTVTLSADKTSAAGIEHLTASGGVVRLATVKMAANQQPYFAQSPVNQIQDANSQKSLGDVELKCRRFDYDAIKQMFLATGPGVIKVDNSNISEPNSDPNSTRDRFSLKKPCFAVIQDFDTLRYLLEPNLLIADARSQQIRIGYVPVVKGEFGRPVNATAAHVEALLYETADGQLELSTLAASGGITYDDGDKEFAGGELFYDADKSLVTVHGDQSWPCRLNGVLVDEIEYDLIADRVKAQIVAPGAFQRKR